MYKGKDKSLSSKKIVHIIHNDKFIAGYVNFMKMEMPAWEHYFIIPKVADRNKFINCNNIFFVNKHYSSILTNAKIKQVIRNADKIIVSGVFTSYVAVAFFRKKYMKKTFLHFWGGDFYGLRKSPDSMRMRIMHLLKIYCCKRCAGFIFLIDGEYDKFLEIVNVEKKHFVAPVPSNPCKQIRRADYRINNRSIKLNGDLDRPVKILVGNSATETNHHVEVFQLLKKFPLNKMKIYSPLSYGNQEYREFILEQGNQILGEAFHPILEFMELENYLSFLTEMDVGIFNNDRQQAMGNIFNMLGLGKKVYARDNTSMWKMYTDEGWMIYPYSSIQEMDFNEFIHFDEKAREKNEALYDARDRIARAKNKWTIVLNANCLN